VEVVVFDDDGPGGSPGTELGAMPVTITNIPVFPDPTPAWNSFDISSLKIVVNDGSVYIGARWESDSLFQVYLDSDENGPGFGGGYWYSTLDNMWAPIQNVFPLYRAMFVRVVEQTGGLAVVSTDRFRHRNAAFARNDTIQGCPQYVITQGTDTFERANTNIGSNCDECDTFIPLPFNFQLYGSTYTGVNVSDNGRLDFVNANEPGGYLTGCLPTPVNRFTGLPYDNTIFALWQDQVTFADASGCSRFPGGECGIFTSVTGSAPNRIFTIEWRTVLYADNTAPQNFGARLSENDPNERFDVIIGTLAPANVPIERQWVLGVQGDGNLGFYTADFCICWPDSPPQNVSRHLHADPVHNAITNTESYSYFHSAAYSHTQGHSDTQGAPNTASTPASVVAIWQRATIARKGRCSRLAASERSRVVATAQRARCGRVRRPGRGNGNNRLTFERLRILGRLHNVAICDRTIS
jgi:hypothetical protein